MANAWRVSSLLVSVGCGLLFAQGTPASPSFAGSSIKPSLASMAGRFQWGPDRLISENYPLGKTIQWAYDLSEYQLPGYGGITSNPKALDDRYVIVAIAGEPEPPDVMQKMTQQLLTQRFQLKVHWDTKSVEGYKPELLPGATFTKLDFSPIPMTLIAAPHFAAMSCTLYIPLDGYTFRTLAQELTRRATNGKPVVDATGLDGAYDLSISFMQGGCVPTDPGWRPPSGPKPGPPEAETVAGRRAAALAQLGSAEPLEKVLKTMGLALVPGKVEVKYLIVDSVGKLIPD